MPSLLERAVSFLGKRSFGIYLVHVFFLSHLHLVGLSGFFIHPLFSIPITAIVVFALSILTIILLNMIPFVKRYVI